MDYILLHFPGKVQSCIFFFGDILLNLHFHIKGIVSDSNNIFLGHKSEDISKKKCYLQNLS